MVIKRHTRKQNQRNQGIVYCIVCTMSRACISQCICYDVYMTLSRQAVDGRGGLQPVNVAFRQWETLRVLRLVLRLGHIAFVVSLEVAGCLFLASESPRGRRRRIHFDSIIKRKVTAPTGSRVERSHHPIRTRLWLHHPRLWAIMVLHAWQARPLPCHGLKAAWRTGHGVTRSLNRAVAARSAEAWWRCRRFLRSYCTLLFGQ